MGTKLRFMFWLWPGRLFINDIEFIVNYTYLGWGMSSSWLLTAFSLGSWTQVLFHVLCSSNQENVLVKRITIEFSSIWGIVYGPFFKPQEKNRISRYGYLQRYVYLDLCVFFARLMFLEVVLRGTLFSACSD